MKKTVLLLFTFYFFSNSFAAFEIKPQVKKANEIFLSLGKDTKITLMDLSVISAKDFEKLSGRHLNFFDRIAFRAGQKKLQKSIHADGTIDNKLLTDLADTNTGSRTGSAIGWFLLGIFLSIGGVLLAYALQAEPAVKKHRIKWAWIGFGVAALFYLLLILLFSSLK